MSKLAVTHYCIAGQRHMAFILAGIVLVRASEPRSDRPPATAEARQDRERAVAGADPCADRNADRNARRRHEDADTEPVC